MFVNVFIESWVLLNKVAGWNPATLFQKETSARVFSSEFNFQKFIWMKMADIALPLKV